MNNKTFFKIVLDIVMTIVFIILLDPSSTGLVFHEVVGLSILAPFVLHILFNKSWVKNITKDLFSPKLKRSNKLKYALNVTLFLGLSTIIITGIIISQVIFPSESIKNSEFLITIHKWSSYLLLGFFSLHIALHGQYLLGSLRRIILDLQERKVRKTLLRLGTAALIIVILYSRIITEVTENMEKTELYYTPQIEGATQDKNAINKNQTQNAGGNMSLSEFLGSMYCTACHKQCSLLRPQCRKADPQIKAAEIEYQERYGQSAK